MTECSNGPLLSRIVVGDYLGMSPNIVEGCQSPRFTFSATRPSGWGLCAFPNSFMRVYMVTSCRVADRPVLLFLPTTDLNPRSLRPEGFPSIAVRGPPNFTNSGDNIKAADEVVDQAGVDARPTTRTHDI